MPVFNSNEIRANLLIIIDKELIQKNKEKKSDFLFTAAQLDINFLIEYKETFSSSQYDDNNDDVFLTRENTADKISKEEELQCINRAKRTQSCLFTYSGFKGLKHFCGLLKNNNSIDFVKQKIEKAKSSIYPHQCFSKQFEGLL